MHIFLDVFYLLSLFYLILRPIQEEHTPLILIMNSIKEILTLIFKTFPKLLNIGLSESVKNVIALPFRFTLPVLPILCIFYI